MNILLRSLGARAPRAGWWAGVLLAVGAATASAQAPALVSATPANGDSDVPVASRQVVFVFSVAMEPNTFLGGVAGFPGAIAWSGEGISGGDFEYGWSDDGKTLTCTYADDFPADTTVAWQLNPPDVFAGLELKSEGGVLLPKGQNAGTFRTGAAGGGGGDGGAPKLVSSNPANGATGVSVSSTVQFVFDQPMMPVDQLGGFPPFLRGAVEFTGTGISASNLGFSWSADARTLTVTYRGGFPGNTLVRWELNPTDMLQLMNEDGEALPTGMYKGSFTTGEGGSGGGGDDECDSDGIPDAWGTYSFAKNGNYRQSSDADPVAAGDDEFMAASFVRGPEDPAKTVESASLALPNGTRKDHEGFFGFYTLVETFATQAALDAAFPGGGYTLRIKQSGTPEQAIAMTVPTAGVPVPKLQNFAEAQAVNPAAPFTLRWNPYSGAAAPNDYLAVSIHDGTNTVFQAPDPCVPRELAVTATSVEIPAATFQAGRTYHATLTFGRQFYWSTNTLPEMVGYGSLGSSTEFTLKTTGGTPTPDAARFVGYRLSAAGVPELTITGTVGQAYTIERADALSFGVWQAAGTATPGADGRASFEDTAAKGMPTIFYRAVAR